MTIKITTPNGGSDSLDFGCAQTPVVATVTGTEVSSGEGKLELKTTTGGTSATKATILANGDVGIGTTAPMSDLHLGSSNAQPSTSGDMANNGLTVSNGSGGRAIQIGVDDTNSRSYIQAGYVNNANTANHLSFLSGATESMRITSTGNVLVGTTSSVANTRMSVERIGGVGNEATIGFTSSGTAKWKIGNNASDAFVVYTPSDAGVYISSGATSWTGTSDERLKNITGNIENALDAVQTLRAVKFTWIADEENKSQVGLIAQDVQAVLPEIISEDAEGYLGIRYTETIPLLVAAIKEQQAIIETLTTRIEALEEK